MSRLPENQVLSPPVPLTWGEYETLDVLGRGQYATVWRARRRAGGKIVALKIFNCGGGVTAAEAEFSGDAGQPHLVRVFRTGVTQGRRFVEMEYCPGETLETMMSDAAYAEKYALGDAVRWVKGVLQALDFMHARRVSHGDVKPGNMMVYPATGEVKLIDLSSSCGAGGDVRLNADRAVTWAYQPPEATGQGVCRLVADIYAAGATLYQLTTGRPPYLTIPDLVAKAPFPRPRELNPQISAGLEAVILKAIHPRRRSRYQRASVMLADLHNYTGPPETGTVPVALTIRARHDLLLFNQLAKRLHQDGDGVKGGALGPTHMDADAGRALSLFAELAARLGYRETAISAYRRLLQEIDGGAISHPDLAEVLHRLERLYRQAGVLPAA